MVYVQAREKVLFLLFKSTLIRNLNKLKNYLGVKNYGNKWNEYIVRIIENRLIDISPSETNFWAFIYLLIKIQSHIIF